MVWVKIMMNNILMVGFEVNVEIIWNMDGKRYNCDFVGGNGKVVVG